MNDMDEIFPTLKKNIENLIEDEEGNIPGNKLLVLGTMVIILGSMLSIDAFGDHGSHSIHGSHTSTSYRRSSPNHYSHSGSHSDHSSHSSHSNSSHSNHSNHGSHSNTASHSSSGGAETSAPAASAIPGIAEPSVSVPEETFELPDVNSNIEVPNGTPTSSIMASLSIPASSPSADIDAGELREPSNTESID